MIDLGMHREPSERSKRDFHTATYNKRGGETVVNSFLQEIGPKGLLTSSFICPPAPPLPSPTGAHPLPIIKKEKYMGQS